jgi:hypothetical protein
LNYNWWQEFYIARATVDRSEHNWVQTSKDFYNGFGGINVIAAINYSGGIIFIHAN